tara:strand:- start:35474 stop:36841 length:1368 start_codon:yes stop_codon:yes gene_type:complete
MSVTTINPANGEKLKTYQYMSHDEVTTIIDSTHKDYLSWKNTTEDYKANLSNKLAEIMLQNKEIISKTMTEEMGKPITQSYAEVEKCADLIKHNTNVFAKLLQDTHVNTEFTKSYVTYQPIGIVYIIMPWNFPLWQVMRITSLNILAGNAIVLKHASICTGTALLIEKLFKDAGFPDNLFRTLVTDYKTSDEIFKNTKIRGLAFTGSDIVGKQVASLAGKHLKKATLELGGADPYIILEDADLENAAEQCIKSRLLNAGQVCIAAKKLITTPKIHEKFCELILEKARVYNHSDPMDPTCKLGPLASHNFRETVHNQVMQVIKEGARCLLGGKIPDDNPGAFYPVTVLDKITEKMPMFDEEIFGPVLSIIPAISDEHALELANNTRFGLSAAVFTNDLQKAEKFAKQIETGTCYINQLVASNKLLPIGGIKDSGFGRELSFLGIHEFVNAKVIVIK